MSQFTQALNEQIASEFAASQQYVAIAVHYDAQTLPQLATRFYRQAVEERNHAMMIVRYLLDSDGPLRIPGVEAPQASFDDDRGACGARARTGEARHGADRPTRRPRP
jgi:ferritin